MLNDFTKEDPNQEMTFELNDRLKETDPERFEAFTRFKEMMGKLANNQAFEIEFSANTIFFPLLDIDIEKELERAAKTPPGELVTFWKREVMLDKITADIITGKINYSSKKLNIENLDLTRIPLSYLSQNEKVKEYLANLEVLYCGKNKLRELPEELGTYCPNLKKFSCSMNQIKTLPASLSKCLNLETLSCRENNLEEIPEFLKDCKKLKWLNLEVNVIKNVPIFLSNLETLHLTGNFIQDLAEPIKVKFGNEWSEQTLQSQRNLVNYHSPNLHA